MSEPVLAVESLSVSYGHVQAVVGVHISVSRGEIVALLGPNGAGKTTTLRAISGLLPVRQGTVRFAGKNITGMRPDRICRVGLVHVPEGRQVIAPLTVEENLEMAGLASRRCPSQDLRSEIAKIYDLFPNLKNRRKSASGLLSGGEQQMLAIGRGLIARPEVLLLDEPSMGLAPVMTDVIYDFLRNRADILHNVGVILAEQSRIALSVANRVCILSKGRIAFSGLVEDADHDVTVQAYLGTRPAPIPSGANP
jgi:branched-chain amino acid transport system ATP-binding protein